MIEDTKKRLRAIRDEVGYAEYDAAQRSLNRERLENTDRAKRKSIPWSWIKKDYQRRKGVCWWCQTPMVLLRNEIEGDHFNPNAENFNDDSNKAAIHKVCNREKGAKSLQEQAEYKGVTVKMLIERFNAK